MKWRECRNIEAIPLKEIPLLSLGEFRDEMLQQFTGRQRVIQFFGREEGNGVRLYAILGNDDHSKVLLSSTHLDYGASYDSLTPQIPSLALFEREFYEQYSITPFGHPWLKPVRNGIGGTDVKGKPYIFLEMEGEEVHEVGVGPIHAGVIEPGHFRFSCHGETVHHLEIQLGFQHRGVEKLFRKHRAERLYLEKLAESIAGDSVIAHAGTFVRALEALGNVEVPRRAKIIRAIALELERMGIHLGDLAALAGDVAYATGNSVFAALRTEVINTLLVLCGSRFGRGLVTTGGTWFDISSTLQKKILTNLAHVEEVATLAAEVMFSSASVLERFEKTGIVEKHFAQEIGMVGPAARASGIAVDVRVDYPFDAYEFFPVYKLTMQTGDVFARAYIRYIEIQQSLKIIRGLLDEIKEEQCRVDAHSLQPQHCVVSLTEGWRGEIAHVLFTNEAGELDFVKIKDPSFHNWFGLALAVRGEGISDFPLCNKSFNLSYCGFDL